jgi:hypothetical protein
MNVRGSAELAVYYPIDFYHVGTVNFLDIIYFVSDYINFNYDGILNSVCDLNHDGTLNFLDVTLLVGYYIASFASK